MFCFSRKAAAFFACAALAVFGLSSAASATTFFVTTTGNDANTGSGPGSPRLTIQEAINDASAGDTVSVGVGTFTGLVNITKRLVIMGAGSGASGTVITSGAGGAGGVVQLNASGLVTNPLLLKDLRIQPTSMAGISVGLFTSSTGMNISYVDLWNVVVRGTNTSGMTEQERGLYVDNTSSLSYLNVTNCAFDSLCYGWYFHKVVNGVDVSNVNHVNVISSEFNHNDAKGVYCEKLNDAMFNDCTFDGNGFTLVNLGATFIPFTAGVDINLKAGNYSGITFKNCNITNNATAGSKEGMGMGIKARSDAASYNTFPATLDNVLVDFCTFQGNERGLRFGEPNKNNAGPTNVIVKHCSFINNNRMYVPNDGSAYGDLVNQSMSTVEAINNWWNTTSDPAIMATVYGPANVSPHLMHNTGKFYYDLAFNPLKPKIVDDTVNVEFRITRLSDSIAGMSFDLVVPRNNFVQNGIWISAYTSAGSLSSVLNYAKNIISYTSTTVTYKIIISPVTGGPYQFLHGKIAGDTSNYMTVKIALKRALFNVNDVIDVKVMNIDAREYTGSPIRAILKGTRIVTDRTITHRFLPSGDINNDGFINVQDLMLIVNHILQIRYLTGPEFSEADLNRDGIVNVGDLMIETQVINGAPISGLQGPGISTALVIGQMEGDNTFKSQRVMGAWFTSAEPMTEVTGLEKALDVQYNEEKTAMSLRFADFTDINIKFGSNHTITGNRIGAALASGVEEEKYSADGVTPNPSTNGLIQITNPYSKAEETKISIYSTDGKKVCEEKMTEEKFSYKINTPGAYYYSIKSGRSLTNGAFIVQ